MDLEDLEVDLEEDLEQFSNYYSNYYTTAVPFWGLQLRCLLQSSNTLVGSTSPLLTRWKSWWRASDAPELHCYIVVYFKY